MRLVFVFFVEFPFPVLYLLCCFLQGFKFTLAMGQQVIVLKEANLALQAKLEEVRNDLAWDKESVSSLV